MVERTTTRHANAGHDFCIIAGEEGAEESWERVLLVLLWPEVGCAGCWVGR